MNTRLFKIVFILILLTFVGFVTPLPTYAGCRSAGVGAGGHAAFFRLSTCYLGEYHCSFSPQQGYELCCNTFVECNNNTVDDAGAIKQDVQINCKNDPQFINTAIGCIKAGDPLALIGQILGWSTILGGLIAFFLTVYGGFQVMLAEGDAKRVKAGQEIITSAIMGLMLIVFSIFLLNFLGFKILNLGGLGLPAARP
jgi:hypothetical protein